MTADVDGARLDWVVDTPGGDPLTPGIHELGVGVARDGLIYVPDADRPCPLLVFLHGAGMNAHQMLRPLVAAADDSEVVLLVPESRGATWDVIMGGFGPDVEFLDAAITHVSQQCALDRGRVAIGGVSDGASYALSLGIANGDRFGAILAFSPGFAMAPDRCGMPRVFVSHGVNDRVLPIDMCSRPLAHGLIGAGYDVDYREFDGGHEMPDAIVRAGFQWLVSH